MLYFQSQPKILCSFYLHVFSFVVRIDRQPRLIPIRESGIVFGVPLHWCAFWVTSVFLEAILGKHWHIKSNLPFDRKSQLRKRASINNTYFTEFCANGIFCIWPIDDSIDHTNFFTIVSCGCTRQQQGHHIGCVDIFLSQSSGNTALVMVSKLKNKYPTNNTILSIKLRNIKLHSCRLWRVHLPPSLPTDHLACLTSSC